MSDIGNLGEDKFIPLDEHQSWLAEYDVTVSGSGKGTSKAVHYPHASYDTMMSAREVKAFSAVDRIDVLERTPVSPPVAKLIGSSGVAVFAGLDGARQPTYRLEEPNVDQVNTPWLNAIRAAQQSDLDKELQEQKLAKAGSVIKAGQGGMLATLGRFVAIPLQRVVLWMAKTFMQALDFGQRLITPILIPIGRALERAGAWVMQQVDRATPYVTAAIAWVGKTTKKVLDTLIIDAPKAAVATVRGWLERLSNWLGS